MKRLLGLLIPVIFIFFTSACHTEDPPVKVAMLVSEKGLFEDNAFYGGAWEGIGAYCKEHGIAYDQYTAEYRNAEQLRKILSEAVDKGAELVVLPGYFFQELAMEAQAANPDIHFILVDSTPNNGLTGDEYKTEVKQNTVSLMFAEEQVGFLAGYSAVMDGYRELGFFGGMPVSAVKRFGYGYAQGAEFAAQQLGLEENSVNLRYLYCGGFVASPEIQARADLWYMQGTEVIFSCGGNIVYSVITAAENAGKYVIGVDVDQSGLSDSIITSAVKRVDRATYNMVKNYFEGEFPGGQILYAGVDTDSVSLEIDNSRFNSFTRKEYDDIIAALAGDWGGIVSGIYKDDAEPEELPLSCVHLQIETMK